MRIWSFAPMTPGGGVRGTRAGKTAAKYLLQTDPLTGDQFDLHEVVLFVCIQYEDVAHRAVQQDKAIQETVSLRRSFVELAQCFHGDGEVGHGIEVTGIYGKCGGGQRQKNNDAQCSFHTLQY
jgi:hypothetical protein